MPFKLLLLYFVIGGLVIATISYFGSQGKSQMAAFIGFLPSTTILTICTIYFVRGTEMAVSYAKSMLILLPPWLLYVVSIIVLLPRIGLVATIAVSVAIYLVIAFLIMRLI